MSQSTPFLRRIKPNGNRFLKAVITGGMKALVIGIGVLCVVAIFELCSDPLQHDGS